MPQQAPPLLWRGRTRLRHVFRAMLSGAVGWGGFLLALLSVLWPLWDLFSDRHPQQSGLFFVVLVVVSFGGSVLISWACLYRLPPEEFARASISGLPSRDVIQLTAHEIWRVCQGLLDEKSFIYLVKTRAEMPVATLSTLADVLTLASFLKELEGRLDSAVAALQKYIQHQQQGSKRILAMKTLAARDLNLPPHRMCDHIFNFSPTLYQIRIEKYARNWVELADMRDSPGLTTSAIHRLNGILAENDRIRAEIADAKAAQLQLIRYGDLLTQVVLLASEHTTSGSLRNYAAALALVAKDSLRRKSRGITQWADCNERLQFLFRKQRVHSGFDLHRLLSRALDLNIERSGASADLVLQRDVLNGTRALGSVGDIETMAKLEHCFDVFLEASRQKIFPRFIAYFEAWSRTPGKKLILTHGFSRTVRDALKELYDRLAEPKPQIFVISPLNSRTDSRLMVDDLKNHHSIGDNNVAFGSESLLLTLGRDFRILVVLGAECFDPKLRVLHPLGIDLAALKARALPFEAGVSRMSVAVLAEEYKRQPNLLELPEFYQDHLDRVDLYPETMIDCVITENGVFTSISSGSSPPGPVI